VLVKPPFITMHAAKHSRESAAKGDDQIAFENATALEEACRHQQALDWYAEVKPTGGTFDMRACAGRVAILLVLYRVNEAVVTGMLALQRMQVPNPELLGEVTRAVNAHCGAAPALALCRQWIRHPANCEQPDLWMSAAGYAAQCGQFGRALRYLVYYLHYSGGMPASDLLLDSDFAPLWHHLEHEALSAEEAAALRHPVWQASRDLLPQVRGRLSFESYAHVPPSLRSILRVHTRSMNWVPHRDTPPAKRAAFDAWCQAVRDASIASLDAGRRKALAMQPVTSGECA
jgi:hypothetical protein